MIYVHSRISSMSLWLVGLALPEPAPVPEAALPGQPPSALLDHDDDGDNDDDDNEISFKILFE